MRFPLNRRRSLKTARRFFHTHGMQSRLDILEQRIVLSTQVAITDAVLAEGDSGSSVMNFTIIRSGDLAPAVTVNFATVDGTALAGADYTAEAGRLTMGSGQTTALISIPVTGNLVVQANRTFTVNLTSVVDAATPLSFSSPTSFSTVNQPVSVTSGDINGDGKPDLVLANYAAGTVSVLLNTTAPGAATPTFSSRFDFPVSLNPVSVAVGDLNGDGLPDMAVANRGSNSVSVLINNGTPWDTVASFAPGVLVDAGQYPSSVAMGDLNGDGKPDLIATNSGDNTVSVMLNATVPGSFAASFGNTKNFAVGTFPTSGKIGDLNGDGKADLVVTNGLSNNVSILFNQTAPGAGTPVFAPHFDLLAQADPVAVAIADFNGDSKPDIAVADKNWDTVSVFTNNTLPGAATPAFSSQTQLRTGQRPTGISVADINGDGLPDIVTSNYNSSNVTILQNTTIPGSSSPSFAAALNVADGTSTQPNGVAVADFNSDGALDIGVANHATSTVALILNTTPPSSSLPSLTPIQSFSTGNRSIAVAVKDINGDGLPDIAVANYTANTVSVLLNTTVPGSTVASFAPRVDFTTGKNPISVVFGDVNGDGKPDLLVANSGSNTVSVLRNTTTPGATTPSFAAKTDLTVGSQPLFVALGDLNGDGMPDIAVANEKTNNVSVLRNTTAPGAATPSFAAKSDFAVGQNPVALTLADINGDGKLDIATANSSSNNASVLINKTPTGTTTTTFASQASFIAGPKPVSIAFGDFNGDGKPDLALTSTNANGDSVSILTNTTTAGSTLATFTPRLALPTAVRPYSITVADFNGDGKPDIAVSNLGSQSASIMLNTSAPGATTPSFANRVDYPMTNPYAITSGDINGDGKPDLITADITVNTASVLINTTVPTITLPDVFGTGTILDDDTPSTIAINGGDNQVVTPGSTLPTKLSVLVKNAAGYPVLGATVTFSAPATGASGTFVGGLTTVTALSDVNGIATAPDFITNTTAGSYSVSALATGLATPVNFSVANFDASQAPAAIAINSGDQQSATVGFGFSTPFSVLVTNASGIAVPGANVTFTAPATDPTGTFPGNVSAVTVITDANGVATAPTFTAGNVQGSYTVSADVVGVTSNASFTLTNVAQNSSSTPASISLNSGNNQFTFNGSTFSSLLRASVTNAAGFPLQGATVTFTAPNSGATGTFAGGLTTVTAQTDVNGLASAPAFTAGTMAGSYTVSAQAAGLATVVNFQLTNVAPNVFQTTTTLTTSKNPTTFGESVTLNALVTATSGTAAGTVTFFDNGNSLGVSSLSPTGVAQLTTSRLDAGAHTITASYSGNATYLASTAKGIQQTVAHVGTSVTLVGTPGTTANGQTVTFVASLKRSTTLAASTGSVSFYDGTVLLGAAPVVNERATLIAPLRGAGVSHSIKAVYSGDSHFVAATSNNVAQKVTKAGSKPTLSITSAGGSTAIVRVVGTYGGVPTGQVTLSVRGAATKKYQLVNGAITVSVPKAGKPSHPFTLKYLGDSNYNGSSSKGSY